MTTPEGKWWRGCFEAVCVYVSERDNKIERASVAGIPMRAVLYTARCTVSYFLLTVLWEGAWTNVRTPREWRGKREVLIECPLRSHQMWLRGIKDSFEGRWERLHTVLTSIQIPSKSLYITLIRPCAVWYTNSHWSYHKAATYHICLGGVTYSLIHFGSCMQV